jgi:hypothetical protein
LQTEVPPEGNDEQAGNDRRGLGREPPPWGQGSRQDQLRRAGFGIARRSGRHRDNERSLHGEGDGVDVPGPEVSGRRGDVSASRERLEGRRQRLDEAADRVLVDRCVRQADDELEQAKADRKGRDPYPGTQ